MRNAPGRRGPTRSHRLVPVLFILAALIGGLPLAARGSPLRGTQPTASVDQAVVEATVGNGTTDFWVEFTASTDLSAAYGIDDWAARGAYVYERLRATAAASQDSVIADLTARGVAFESLWIANALFVRGGDRTTLDTVRNRPGVLAVREPQSFDLPEPVTEPDQPRPQAVEWGIANIRADQVWAQFGVRGEGIVVANIDSGVQFDHPALVNQYRGNLGGGDFDHNYSWWDPNGNCGAPCDHNGHGTHTMGTMVGDDGAGNQIGVAPGARWMSALGCPAACPDFNLLSSGQFVLAPTDLDGENPRPDLRAHVVNNSWGLGNLGDESPFFGDVIDAWTAAGIFGVFSNGNEGPECDSTGSPADNPNAWGVGAYDINNEIAVFSSRGPGGEGELKPNIAAPGVDVRSSLPTNNYAIASGTSMSAPHQSGAVALMWSAAPTLVDDVTETRAILEDSAVDVDAAAQCGGTVDDNNVFGEGRLDVLAAVEASPRGPTGTLAGTVTDAGTGAGIGGATVGLPVAGRTRTTTADADGDYSLLGVPVGAYDVTAAAFGYLPQTRPADIEEGATTTLDFSLTAAPTHSVSGTVTDADDNPVSGVTVAILATPIPPATTDAGGHFAFAAVPEATYTVSFTAGGCVVGTSVEVVVDGDEVVNRELARRTDGYGHVCRLDTPAYVEADTVLPLDGFFGSVEVDLPFAFPFYGNRYASAWVSPGGFMNFAGPFDGIGNSSIPFRFLPNDGIFPFWDALDVGPDGSVRTEAIDGGFVIEWRNVRPLDDVPRPERWDIEVVLFENGEILFQYRNIDGTGVEAGDSATIGIENADGSDALLFSMEQPVVGNDRAIRFLPPPSGYLTGTVTDGNDGLPVAGAMVTTSNGRFTRTDFSAADGSYFLALPLGAWSVQYRGIEYPTEPRSVTVDQVDERLDLDVALPSGVVSVDPGAIDLTLPADTQQTVAVELTNTGTLDLVWEAHERKGTVPTGSPSGAPNGTLERFFQSAPTTMSANVEGGTAEATPSAARWTPDVAAPTALTNILLYADVFDEDPGDMHPEFALRRLGLPYTAFYHAAFAEFEAALEAGQWDLVIFANDAFLPPPSTYDALNTWAAGGGRLIFHSWSLGFFADHPLWATLGATFVGPDDDPPEFQHWWQPDHPLFTDPEAAPELGGGGGCCGTYGQSFEPRAGFDALGGLTNVPAFNQATLVIGNANRTLFRGFIDSHTARFQALPFWVNSIDGMDRGFVSDVPWLEIAPTAGTLAPGATEELAFSIDTTGLAEGVYTAPVVVAGNAGRVPRVTIPITLTVGDGGGDPDEAVRINVGGSAFTDGAGSEWEADQAFDGTWGFEGQSRSRRTSTPIAATDDDALYQDARTGRDFDYRFDGLEPGTYEIELHFAEIQGRRSRQRVFDVFADSVPLLVGFDISRTVGQNTAVAQRFTVDVTDGQLRVRFRDRFRFGEPILNALVLRQQD